MEILFKSFLTIHIIGGLTGLLAGSVNLLMKKGGLRHKKIGNLFVWGMLSAGGSSLILSLLHPNYFLFMVGVFTLYMVLTGKRYLYLKLIGKGRKATWFDWGLSLGMALVSLFLVGLGIIYLIHSISFGFVFIVFGIFGLLFVKEDLSNYREKSIYKNYWLLAHISRMVGGYIASITAFLVVNAKYIPFEFPLFILWIFPSLLLVPFIIKWSKKYGLKKLN